MPATLNKNVKDPQLRRLLLYSFVQSLYPQFLKTLFHIQPGDFYYHNKWDIEKTIMDQLSKIYLDDFITQEEAELKSAIQETFDLSYDQMNDYAKIKAAVWIQNGVTPKDLGFFFTYEKYFKLKPK
jgi:hypothetical protein